MSRFDIPYGERAVSWSTILQDLFPMAMDEPHDDECASEMHRLRGLVVAQAAETEDVLGRILRVLDSTVRLDRPAGVLFRAIKAQLTNEECFRHANDLQILADAIKSRNRAVHSSVTIGSSWRDYAAGGGEWVPVISFLGDELCDESNLLRDLADQQQATMAAVRIFKDVAAQRLSIDL